MTTRNVARVNVVDAIVGIRVDQFITRLDGTFQTRFDVYHARI